LSWFCAMPGCRERGVWRHEDSGVRFCDAHTGCDLDAILDKEDERRDIGDEWARDAAREARER
jgi:hypothetical protein